MGSVGTVIIVPILTSIQRLVEFLRSAPPILQQRGLWVNSFLTDMDEEGTSRLSEGGENVP